MVEQASDNFDKNSVRVSIGLALVAFIGLCFIPNPERIERRRKEKLARSRIEKVLDIAAEKKGEPKELSYQEARDMAGDLGYDGRIHEGERISLHPTYSEEGIYEGDAFLSITGGRYARVQHNVPRKRIWRYLTENGIPLVEGH